MRTNDEGSVGVKWMMEEDRADEIIREVLEHWDDEEWEVPDCQES